jgi:hypothetical protein
MAKSFLGSSLGGSILDGIGSALEARARRKEAKENRRHEVDQVRNEGDETRRTALYGMLLGDWKQRKDKYRKTQGLDNYKAFANQAIKPSSEFMSQMRNFNSPNQVQDPGAAPDPQALHGQPQGNPRDGGYKPMYRVTDNGQIESLNPNMRPKPSALRPGG